MAAARYCTACGALSGADHAYCARCGARLAAGGPEDAPAGDPAPAAGQAAPTGQAPGDSPYPGWATPAAVAVTVFLPFIALVAALVLRSTEQHPGRRQFLRNWAIGSGVWLCIGLVIPVIVLASAVRATSGCRGGIDQMVPPSYVSNDNVHWVATYTCMNGGTETKSVPASQVPGGP